MTHSIASALFLDTRFEPFTAPTFGIHGLARITGPKIEIIAVAADVPGVGCFRDWIKNLKTEFQEIYIWEVWNDFLPAVLARYGFEPICMLDTYTAEVLEGFKWSK
jgi:hypothetical protein